MSAVPDLLAPVVGFRAWRIVDRRLLSPHIPVRWEGRTMQASCYPANRRLTFGRGWLSAPHASPDPECKCGIYAYHRPGVRSWFGEFEWVEGVVACWGRLEAHADGLRAERARVEGLVTPGDGEASRRGAVEVVAARLGVPVVARAQLEDFAAQVGAPLPPALLP
ncbi:MAG TPA: hypothetical protein VGV40_03425 [Solirubrobacteraceae bacterium]|nr:hypothetical protein [Solirubrobacteraceae bacterium]